jgi:uncharacterized membrane-anchored protein
MLDRSSQPKQPHLGLSPEFAATQGANILLAMGVVLFLIGCVALVIGHTTIAALLLIAVGLLTVIIAARLGGLAMLVVEVVKVKATATFNPAVKNDANGSDDSSAA